VERLATRLPDQVRALVLVGAYAGLRWGEAAGLTRGSIDVLRNRITVTSTAIQVGGRVILGQEPKPSRSKRTIPVARSVMRRIEEHLAAHVAPDADALLFTAAQGGPMFRGTISREVWRPAVTRAGLADLTFHGLRHSFVAIMVAAGCNVREVSEWAGQRRGLHLDPVRRPVRRLLGCRHRPARRPSRCRPRTGRQDHQTALNPRRIRTW
jgi:integrase